MWGRKHVVLNMCDVHQVHVDRNSVITATLPLLLKKALSLLHLLGKLLLLTLTTYFRFFWKPLSDKKYKKCIFIKHRNYFL